MKKQPYCKDVKSLCNANLAGCAKKFFTKSNAVESSYKEFQETKWIILLLRFRCIRVCIIKVQEIKKSFYEDFNLRITTVLYYVKKPVIFSIV